MNRILVIGNYNESYQRNRVLIDSFKNNFEVKEFNVAKNRYKHLSFLNGLFRFGKKQDYIFLIRDSQRFTFVIMLYKIFLKKKIIFDAFTSIYNSWIFDRKLAGKYSVKSLYYYILDYLTCYFSDILVFDTEEHKDYFVKTFKIKDSKKKVILPVSLDLDFYDSVKKEENNEIFPKDKFNVFFYGYYIPLQGVEYIVKAAKILEKEENINFILLGSGQTKKKVVRLSKELKSRNITFVDRVSYDPLIKYIKNSDVCLGIFGNTDKAKRVVPNKVLEYMACRKLVISGRNKSMERYFEDGEDIIFCNMADADSLAEKILYVYKNKEKLSLLKQNSFKKLKENFSRESLIENIKNNF